MRKRRMFTDVAIAARSFPGMIAIVAATGHRVGTVARRVRESRKHDPLNTKAGADVIAE